MYLNLGFWRFMLGLIVVAIPAAMLSRSGNDRWAMRYVGLILLMLIVSNWRGVEAFSRFMGLELAR